VFTWFSALKIVGMSPADGVVASVIYLILPGIFIPLFGVWEVLIGICLLYRPLIPVGLVLLFHRRGARHRWDDPRENRAGRHAPEATGE
jgi:hypothetical protein